MHWCVLLMHVELLKMIYILLWTARCQYLIIFECDMLKFMLCANDWKGIDKDYFIFVFEIFSVKKWNTLKMIIGISSTYFEAKGMKSNQRTPTRTQEKKRNHIKVLRPASLSFYFSVASFRTIYQLSLPHQRQSSISFIMVSCLIAIKN